MARYELWYRIRQGVYRIVYKIQDQSLMVIVVKIGHRRKVCKNALIVRIFPGNALQFHLLLPELFVQGTAGKQLVMGTVSHQIATLQHDDAVCTLEHG